MHTFLAFLRGINVSGKNVIKMLDLKAALESPDFQHVQTYIQSGNIVFESPTADRRLLEQKMTDKIKETFGFDVPVLIRSPKELEKIIAESPFQPKIGEEKELLYFTLLKEEPSPERRQALESKTSEIDEIQVIGTTVYVLCRKNYGESVFSNNWVEKMLKIPATTRNLATMQKMLELGRK